MLFIIPTDLLGAACGLRWVWVCGAEATRDLCSHQGLGVGGPATEEGNGGWDREHLVFRMCV